MENLKLLENQFNNGKDSLASIKKGAWAKLLKKAEKEGVELPTMKSKDEFLGKITKP